MHLTVLTGWRAEVLRRKTVVRGTAPESRWQHDELAFQVLIREFGRCPFASLTVFALGCCDALSGQPPYWLTRVELHHAAASDCGQYHLWETRWRRLLSLPRIVARLRKSSRFAVSHACWPCERQRPFENHARFGNDRRTMADDVVASADEQVIASVG